LRNYLFRIAHNRAVSHVARHAARPGTTGFADDEHAHHDDPERQLSRAERSETLMDAIRSLPASQKQVVTLSLEGFSYDEISDIAGITTSNVGVRLNRAREALKKRLNAP
jgi:RNA polymerase sigma-70 factor (ECF subfamily)